MQQGQGQYALSAEALTEGVLGVHLRLLDGYLTQPLNLDRPAAVALQAGRSAANVKGWLSRYLGFCGSRFSMEYLKATGLLILMEGEAMMHFISYLLRERQIALTSIVQATLALVKVCCLRHSAQPHRSSIRAAPEPQP